MQKTKILNITFSWFPFSPLIKLSTTFDFDLTSLECNGQTGFQLADKYGYSDIINIIKTQKPDSAIDYSFPLIEFVNNPATYVHFCMDVKTFFSSVIEGHWEKI